MDSLGDILGNKQFRAPDEFAAVREFIRRRYNSPCFIKIQREALIVTVKGSALAASIQLDRQRLIQDCHLTKKLVIRARQS